MASFKDLIVGEVLSEVQKYKVVKIAGDKVQLCNDYGENIVVDSTYVDKCLSSASEVKETKKVTKTEAAEIFLKNTSVAMTVSYNKLVKPEDVTKEVMSKISDAKIGEIEKAVKEGIKKAIVGEERLIVGVHYGSTDDFGRTHFIDMQLERDVTKDYDTRQRLVDSRTINFIIVRGVKYIVKK